jgi:DNA-binding Lrp family transcriptional regulator
VDKTDVILCQLLLANSRLSYRELADKLNLSVTAVHNRIQTLIDQGVIRKFTAKPSIFATEAIHILIFGTSKAPSIKDLKGKLNQNNQIYWLAVGGGNLLYVGAYIKNIVELEPLVSFVKDTAQIPEPTVGITGSPIPAAAKILKAKADLCDLDYKIINSMKDDSRKNTAAIAEELGVSAKTVRRRLTRMISNYLIELSIEWFPDQSNDIVSAFHVTFKPEADKNAPYAIWQKYYPNTLFYWSFSNIPNVYLFMVWTPTSKELRESREAFEQEPSVATVSPNVIYTGYIFNTWRDEISQNSSSC